MPSFRFPEAAARALGKETDHADRRRRPEGAVPRPDGVDRDAAKGVVDRVLAAQPGGGWLGAGDAAVELRFPVALKVGAAEVVHKTDVGGVRLDLGSREAVEAAYVQDGIGRGVGDVVVAPQGLSVVDVKVRVAPAQPRPELAVRRLRCRPTPLGRSGGSPLDTELRAIRAQSQNGVGHLPTVEDQEAAPADELEAPCTDDERFLGHLAGRLVVQDPA